MVPLFKAALFGNDAKDAYSDEGANAAAASAVVIRAPISDLFQGKPIL